LAKVYGNKILLKKAIFEQNRLTFREKETIKFFKKLQNLKTQYQASLQSQAMLKNIYFDIKITFKKEVKASLKIYY
jgi:hypothetical protein